MLVYSNTIVEEASCADGEPPVQPGGEWTSAGAPAPATPNGNQERQDDDFGG